MSSFHKSDTLFSHPFNSFIVQTGIVNTHNLLTSEGTRDKREASKNLWWFLAWFEREAKQNLNKQITSLQAAYQPTEDEQAFWTTISDIANELHDKGYFNAAKSQREVLLGGETQELAKAIQTGGDKKRALRHGSESP